MAITWDFNITNVSISKGRGDITATRTDSESALPPRTYPMRNTPIETPEERAKALTTFKEWDTTAANNKAAIEVFLDSLEQSAKTNMESWELTR